MTRRTTCWKGASIGGRPTAAPQLDEATARRAADRDLKRHEDTKPRRLKTRFERLGDCANPRRRSTRCRVAATPAVKPAHEQPWRRRRCSSPALSAGAIGLLPRPTASPAPPRALWIPLRLPDSVATTSLPR